METTKLLASVRGEDKPKKKAPKKSVSSLRYDQERKTFVATVEQKHPIYRAVFHHVARCNFSEGNFPGSPPRTGAPTTAGSGSFASGSPPRTGAAPWSPEPLVEVPDVGPEGRMDAKNVAGARRTQDKAKKLGLPIGVPDPTTENPEHKG